jgi:hypothetical protein
MQFVAECRTMAQRAEPSHRELLLEMADAWAWLSDDSVGALSKPALAPP